MRFVALALILLSLPLLFTWLKDPRYRRYAMTFLGMGYFLAGVVQLDAALIAWPLWAGTVRGVSISLIDMVSLALIFTRPFLRKRLPFTWLFWGYLAAVSLSFVSASVPMASLFYLLQLLRFTIMFVAIAPELANLGQLRALLNGLALGLITQAYFVIFEKLHGVIQASGTMGHQNSLGIMTELSVIPIVGALLGGERSNLMKIGVVAGLLIIAGGGSRATMGLTAVGLASLLVLSLIQGSTPVKMRIVGLGVLVSLVVAPLGYKTLTSRFGANVNVAEDQQRLAMEDAARAMASDHFFGVGANLYVTTANTKGYSQRAGVTWGGNTRAAPVHNAFLLARAETGWLGEMFFLLLFVIPILAGFRHAFRYRHSLDGSIALGCAVALSSVAYHSQYEFATQAATPQGLCFINLAIVAGLVRARRLTRPRPATSSRPTPALSDATPNRPMPWPRPAGG